MSRRQRKHVGTSTPECVALIASNGRAGVVLEWDGDALDAEIRGASPQIGDLGTLVEAPCGLTIWEGRVVYGDESVWYDGTFRKLTCIERYKYALTGCAWDVA